MWTHGEGLWVTAWSTEIRHIYREENINSSPLCLLSKADKFFQLTFLGMSCDYHFIIIGNCSTAFKKKKKKNATETIKAVLNELQIANVSAYMMDWSGMWTQRKALLPLLIAQTPEGTFWSPTDIYVLGLPRKRSAVSGSCHQQKPDPNITLNDGSKVHLQKRVVDHQLKLLPFALKEGFSTILSWQMHLCKALLFS